MSGRKKAKGKNFTKMGLLTEFFSLILVCPWELWMIFSITFQFSTWDMISLKRQRCCNDNSRYLFQRRQFRLPRARKRAKKGRALAPLQFVPVPHFIIRIEKVVFCQYRLPIVLARGAPAWEQTPLFWHCAIRAARMEPRARCISEQKYKN